MSKLKQKHNPQFNSVHTTSFNNSSALPVDELDGIFRSNVNTNQTAQSQSLFGDVDIFGGSVPSSNQYGGIDFESALNSSSNRKNGSNLNVYDDLLGSKSKQSDLVDDLIGNFGVNSGVKQEKKGSGFDDLIPGFGGTSPWNKGGKLKINPPPSSNSRPSNSRTVEDADASWPFTSPTKRDIGKDSVQSLIDEANGVRNTSKKTSAGTYSNGFDNVDILDEIFVSGRQQNHAKRPSSTTQDSPFDTIFHKEKVPEVKQTSSRSSPSTKKSSSATNSGNDFISLFGDVVTSSGEFNEIDGEPEERRRARLNRHMRMNARMAEALAEKNERDLQSQNEQEEKHRLAETLDNDIRRWAAGKEGNLRSLLSSLQQVLWPGCGWRAVSLTDLITSDSVKKAYKKATLYVHPDKVQQKGANLQQKYVAEKVFDLLKEAWNKFSAEELR